LHSYIACGSLTGEYNITKTGRLSFRFPKGKYHFCPWAQQAADFVTKIPYGSFGDSTKRAAQFCAAFFLMEPLFSGSFFDIGMFTDCLYTFARRYDKIANR